MTFAIFHVGVALWPITLKGVLFYSHLLQCYIELVSTTPPDVVMNEVASPLYSSTTKALDHYLFLLVIGQYRLLPNHKITCFLFM